jgi:hypothetical protein
MPQSVANLYRIGVFMAAKRTIDAEARTSAIVTETFFATVEAAENPPRQKARNA